jgi:chorismate-pyruvate lyase
MLSDANPDLRDLFYLFPPASYLGAYTAIAGSEMPQPYRDLLVHEHHMTVTVETHHHSLVDVKVLERRRDGNSYARKILLTRQSDGRVVMFGLVRIWLHYCSEQVREEIVAEQTPIGRILIHHNVLRRIEPTEYLRIIPGPDMMQWFGLSAPEATYGRLALIHCDGQPAVELLEIVAPERLIHTMTSPP